MAGFVFMMQQYDIAIIEAWIVLWNVFMMQCPMLYIKHLIVVCSLSKHCINLATSNSVIIGYTHVATVDE